MTADRKQNDANPAKISRQKAMNTAVRILANRDHSKYELKRKLQQRGFESKSINTVMVECERFGYIDDKRTARIYILQLKRKCFGKRYIQQALKKKRLSGAAIEKILSENYQKKMKAFERVADPQKRSDKIYRFLYSRGFSPAVIRDLIQNLVK
jgi:regulatory protein